MAKGVFEINDDGTEFDLKPKDIPDPIPYDQRELSHGIYSTWNTLKLLCDRGALPVSDPAFLEYRKRLLEAARVGLVNDNIKFKLASDALVQIQDDILKRKGMDLYFRYMLRLLFWAAAGAVVGGTLILVAQGTGQANLAGYGWVVIGSMAGAWLTVAASRWRIGFGDLPRFVESRLEPLIRLVWVCFVAVTFAFLLHMDVVSLSLGSQNLAGFDADGGRALLLGLVAGLSERALAARIVAEVDPSLRGRPSPA